MKASQRERWMKSVLFKAPSGKSSQTFKSCRQMQMHRSPSFWISQTSRYQHTNMPRCPVHSNHSIGRPSKPYPEPDSQTPPSRRSTDIACLTCSSIIALMQSVSNVWLPYCLVNLVATHHSLDQIFIAICS